MYGHGVLMSLQTQAKFVYAAVIVLTDVKPYKYKLGHTFHTLVSVTLGSAANDRLYSEKNVCNTYSLPV
jgi:hypothetical protein